MAAGFYFALTGPLRKVLHRMIAWQADRYKLEMLPAAGLDTMRANIVET